MEVKITTEPKGYKASRGFRGWHSYIQFEAEGYSMYISDSVGGCGMQQLFGWYTITNPEVCNAMIKKMLDTLHNGVGLVICQVGSPYYEKPFVKLLEKYGFVASLEYNNYQHDKSGNYKQKLYTYHVPIKK